eukprot:5451212-Amphidinium_carterae.1
MDNNFSVKLHVCKEWNKVVGVKTRSKVCVPTMKNEFKQWSQLGLCTRGDSINWTRFLEPTLDDLHYVRMLGFCRFHTVAHSDDSKTQKEKGYQP